MLCVSDVHARQLWGFDDVYQTRADSLAPSRSSNAPSVTLMDWQLLASGAPNFRCA